MKPGKHVAASWVAILAAAFVFFVNANTAPGRMIRSSKRES
jgi:hypothetical protein